MSLQHNNQIVLDTIQNLDDIPGIKREVSLAEYTTWKIGGPARLFWEPERKLLPTVLKICNNQRIPVYFLGRGSNVLIDDKGLDGLVICTKRSLRSISHNGSLITAEAGVTMPELSKYAANLGYGGFEFLIGIPGTVGAGVAINAGLTAKTSREIKDILVDVDILTEEGELKSFSVKDLDMTYRSSILLQERYYVLQAKFKLYEQSNLSEIRRRTAEHLADRKRKQPLTKPTAGSTFKQPIGRKPAGWYIDQAELKGTKIGGAVVSKKHANWIENTGTASSHDVKELIEYIQKVVYEKYNIFLEREVRFLPDDIQEK